MVLSQNTVLVCQLNKTVIKMQYIITNKAWCQHLTTLYLLTMTHIRAFFSGINFKLVPVLSWTENCFWSIFYCLLFYFTATSRRFLLSRKYSVEERMHELLSNKIIHPTCDTDQPKTFCIIFRISVMRNTSVLLIRRFRIFPIFSSNVGLQKDWEKWF